MMEYLGEKTFFPLVIEIRRDGKVDTLTITSRADFYRVQHTRPENRGTFAWLTETLWLCCWPRSLAGTYESSIT